MSISTSSTDHGHFREGWTQEESASPHIVGGSGGGTRQTTFDAQATATSDLLLGTDLAVDGPFDTAGNVLNLSLAGDAVSTASYDVDSKFLPVREIPAVSSGYEEAALDLVQRLIEPQAPSLPWDSRGVVHAFYPLRGYQQGFQIGNGQPYYQDTWGRSVTSDGSPNASWYWGTSAIPAYAFIRLTEGVYCAAARPLWAPIITGTGVNYAAMRVRLNNSSSVRVRLTIWAGNLETVLNIRVNRGSTGNNGTIDTFGSYRKYGEGSLTNVAQTWITTSGVDMSKEFAFAVHWGWLTDAVDGTLRLKGYVWDPASPPGGAPPNTHQVDLVNAQRGELISNGTEIARTAGVGGFRDVVLSQAPGGTAYHCPAFPEPGLISHDFPKSDLGAVPGAGVLSFRPPIHAYVGSGWEYLKQLVAARGLQMRVDAGKLHFEPLSTATPVEIVGATKPPQLEVTGSGRARTVDVVARMSEVTNGFSSTDRNHIITNTIQLRVDDESTHKFQLPPGEHLVGDVRVTVTDSENRAVAWSAMYGRGARFTPTVDRHGMLTVQVRGPQDSVGIGVGPWDIRTIGISNQGFFETPETITLHTGAAESMVTRDRGATVDNVFLNGTGEAIERGMWAAQAYGWPEMTLSFTVPASHRNAYLPGSLVKYGFAVYRVATVKHSKATTDVTATRYVTVAMRDAAWAGYTITQHDAFTAGRRYLDAHIRPLETPAARPPFRRAYPSESRY